MKKTKEERDLEIADELLDGMSDRQKKLIAEEIAKACEKSYRRGFHHGFFCYDVRRYPRAYLIDNPAQLPKLPTNNQVTSWRHRDNLNRAFSPPGAICKLRMSSLERLDIELGGNSWSFPFISNLLFELSRFIKSA